MVTTTHWLDKIIAENRTPRSLIHAIASSDEFMALVCKSIEKGLAHERRFPTDVRKTVGDYAPQVRMAICRGFAQHELDLRDL